MTSTTSSRRPLHAPALAAATLAGLVLLLGACSSSDQSPNSSSADAGSSGEIGSADLDQPLPPNAAPDEYTEEAAGKGAADQVSTVADRAVISKATVSLSSDDVAQARFDVQKIVDQYDGEVAEEQTDGGEEMRRSRLVIRVPSADFGEAVAALEKVGELEQSTRKSEDVTTTVIDNAARIRAQEQSLQRVEVLLGRATSISDIVAIEAQLTRRQADLDSLKSQQAFLADQTSLSTIAVHIERARAPEEKPDTDDAGFFSGLADGWHALTQLGTGLATVAGALLPFAVLFGLLGWPALVTFRRLARRRRPSPAASAAPAAP